MFFSWLILPIIRADRCEASGPLILTARDSHERRLRRPLDGVWRAAVGFDPGITFATVCSTVPITLPRIFPTARPTFWACPREVEAFFAGATGFFALGFFRSTAAPVDRRGLRSMT